MKKALDSREQEEIEAGQGDESGTGLDLLDEILASCRLIGESDLDAAAAQAKEEMEAYKRWLLSGELIHYLGIIIKGRDGLQVKGPVTLTRFSGTIDPEYAGGTVEIVRLNAAGERQNVLLRCPLRRLGPEGISISEEYKRIGQTLSVKIAPNDLGGFNLDVAVLAQELARAVGGGSPISNGGGSKRVKAARANGAAAGGGALTIPPFMWPSTSSIPNYVMGVILGTVVLSLLLFKVFSSERSESHLRGAENTVSGQLTSVNKSGGSKIEQEVDSTTPETAPTTSVGIQAKAEKPNTLPQASPAKIADSQRQVKRREKLASVGKIVIVIAPEGKDDRATTDIREAFATDLQGCGFIIDEDQTKANVLVMRKNPDDTVARRTVFINVSDKAGEKDDCTAQANTQVQAALRELSEMFVGELPIALSTGKEQCVEEPVQVEPVKVEPPKIAERTF
jgi:hypothetical protein